MALSPLRTKNVRSSLQRAIQRNRTQSQKRQLNRVRRISDCAFPTVWATRRALGLISLLRFNLFWFSKNHRYTDDYDHRNQYPPCPTE